MAATFSLIIPEPEELESSLKAQKVHNEVLQLPVTKADDIVEVLTKILRKNLDVFWTKIAKMVDTFSRVTF